MPRRRAELALFAYTPVWIGIMAWLVFSHAYRGYHDREYLLLGLGEALPVWLLPLAMRGPARAHGLRLAWLITIYSFLQCAFGSWLFFDAFGMRYGFDAHPSWRGTPIFLYFVTIAYFATYFVILGVADRALPFRGPKQKLARWIARAALAYGVAFAETFTMASPYLSDVFTYRDPAWMARWGSIFYGTVFFIAYPQIARLFDEEAPPPSWRAIFGEALARNMAALIVYDVYGFLLIR